MTATLSPPVRLAEPKPEIMRFGPFGGFFSAGGKHEAPPGYLTADSRDWTYSPKRGKWRRRKGSAIKGDTITSGHETTGILSGTWSAKGRKLIEMTSSSLSDGYPTVLGLWTNESTMRSELAFYNTNSSAWQRLSTQTAGDLGSGYFRMVPNWSENSITTSRNYLNVGSGTPGFDYLRTMAAGSRGMIQIGQWIYLPNAQTIPTRHNSLIRDGVSALGPTKIWPTGHMPPLRTPELAIPAATANGTETWTGTDRFLFTIAFEYEDGSVGRPFIPRSTAIIPAVAGLTPVQNRAGYCFSVDAAASANKYAYVEYQNIPNGGPGVKNILILRTPKVNQSGLPSIYVTINGVQTLQLGLVARIANGTTNTYRDYNGDDAALFTDPINIRFADHVWPRRARSIFTFDGHVAVCGKIKPNPAALIVGPYLFNTTYYTADDSGTYSAGKVAVREDQVANPRVAKALMLMVDGEAEPTAPITSGSLQSICDTINSSLAATTTTTKRAWGCQIVPGADPSATISDLDLTQIYANFSTNSTKTITVQNGGDGAAGSVAKIKVGMLITGAGIPNRSYVGSIAAPNINMVDSTGADQAATATANPVALKFGWDTGDNESGGYGAGEYGAYLMSYPVVLYFKGSYLSAYTADDLTVDFTGADPGHAKYAANSWYFKNRRSVPAIAGRVMGGGEVLGGPGIVGGMVYFTKGRAALINPRAGNTNLDDDWKMPLISGSRGAISDEIAQGNGCVFALTPQGIEVCDLTGAHLISQAIYDPTENAGSLAYEIGQCIISAASGGDTAQFHMHVDGGRLFVTFRSSGSVTYPDRMLVYDFSPTAGTPGAAGALKPDGTPYGWSCEYLLRIGVMGTVRDGSGTHYYGMIDANAGTNNGRVDEFETGYQDNGTAIVPIGYFAAALDGDMREFVVSDVMSLYKKNGTGLRIGMSRDRSRSGIDYLALPTSGTDDYAMQRMPVSTPNRELLEMVLTDDGSISTGAEFSRMVLVLRRVASTQRR